MVGISIGICHWFIRIPDIYLDLSFVTDFVNFIHSEFESFYSSVQNLVGSFKTHGGYESSIHTKSDLSPSIASSQLSTPLRNISRNTITHTHERNKSTESVLDIASKLPSDFFQSTNRVNKINENTHTTPRKNIYNTPMQSPLQMPLSNNSSFTESELSDADLWDRFDSLDGTNIPITLRTEDTTIRTTRVNKHKKRRST